VLAELAGDAHSLRIKNDIYAVISMGYMTTKCKAGQFIRLGLLVHLLL